MNTSTNVHDVVRIEVRDVEDHTTKLGHDCRWRTFRLTDKDGQWTEFVAFASDGVGDALKLPHEKAAEVAEVKS